MAVKALRLTNAQRKRVHLRRDRPSIEWRTIVANEPLPEDDLTDVRKACDEHGADVVMDSWLSLGLDVALDRLGDQLDFRGIWNQRRVVGLARRLRERIATADDATYTTQVEHIAGWHSTSLQSALAAYLLPSEPALGIKLAHAVDRSELLWLLLSVDEADQLTHIQTLASYQRFDVFAEDAPATLADAMGTDLLPYLYGWLGMNVGSGPVAKQLIGLAMEQRTSDAWSAVLQRVGYAEGRDAFKRGFRTSPELAAKVFLPALAEHTSFGAKHRHLGMQLIADHGPLIDAAMTSYDERTLAFVAEVRATLAPPSDQEPAQNMPALVANPPWENRTKQAKRLTVADVQEQPLDAVMCWNEGERDAWMGPQAFHGELADASNWEQLDRRERRQLLAFGDVDELRSRAREFTKLNVHHRSLVARFELDLAPAVHEFVHRRKQGWETPAWALVLPCGLPDLAAPIVDVYGKSTNASRFAAAWMERHIEIAANHLIPRVVSPARKGRSVADAALRLLARHDETVVRSVAAKYGETVVAAVDQFLSVDPLDVLPTKIPAVPGYLRPELLDAPSLIDTGETLTSAAVENVVIMLGLSKETEYAGIQQVRQLCDPDSLATFSLSVYRAWSHAGRVRKDAWLASGIELFGNDSIVPDITGHVSKGQKVSDDYRRNQIDLLGRIGSDAALASLFHISNVIPRKVTARDARKKVEEMAELRGLTAEQLGDRLIRSFDLDDEGSLALDFGPRGFTVSFDETLTPVVRAEDGSSRKSLPKPKKDDDATLAADAYRKFTRLKRDVKDTAKEQVKRFEQAMVLGRRWTFAEVDQFFASHPLMRHLVRRLVWAVYESADLTAGTTTSFRIAEDGSLAGSTDELVTVPPGATVGVAHPVELVDLAAWSEIFADYELGQPFEQLSRAIFTADAAPPQIDLGAAVSLVGDPLVPYQRILGLTSRGWANEHIGSSTGNFTCQLRQGRLHLPLRPGFAWGQSYEDQRIGPVSMAVDDDPVDTSEVLRDLVWLTRPA